MAPIPAEVVLGESVTVRGKVSQARRAKVVLQRRTAAGWSTLRQSLTDGRGRFRFATRSSVEQRLVLRVVAPRLKGRVAKGLSPRLRKKAVSPARAVNVVSPRYRWVNQRDSFVDGLVDVATHAISADGQYVAFTSRTPLTIDAPPQKTPAAYVWDRRTGRATRISSVRKFPTSSITGDIPLEVTISGDGRYVAYTAAQPSDTGGIALGDGYPGVTDGNQQADVILWDRATNARSVVSTNFGGGSTGSRASHSPSISPNGAYVAFSSQADDLVAGIPASPYHQIYRWTRATGQVDVVSIQNGVLGNGDSYQPAVANDGTVVFASAATNFASGDTNKAPDIFMSGKGLESYLLTRDTQGGAANGGANGPTISADGSVVAFESSASNLVPDDDNNQPDAFAWTLTTGRTVLVSHALGSSRSATGSSTHVTLSPDGRYVGFTSAADDLFAGDTKDSTDLLIRNLKADDLQVLTRFGERSYVTNDLSQLRLASGAQYASAAADVVPGGGGRPGDMQYEILLWSRGGPWPRG